MLLKDEETAIESGRDWPLIALFSRSVVRERLVLEKRRTLAIARAKSQQSRHDPVSQPKLDYGQTLNRHLRTSVVSKVSVRGNDYPH